MAACWFRICFELASANQQLEQLEVIQQTLAGIGAAARRKRTPTSRDMTEDAGDDLVHVTEGMAQATIEST